MSSCLSLAPAYPYLASLHWLHFWAENPFLALQNTGSSQRILLAYVAPLKPWFLAQGLSSCGILAQEFPYIVPAEVLTFLNSKTIYQDQGEVTFVTLNLFCGSIFSTHCWLPHLPLILDVRLDGWGLGKDPFFHFLILTASLQIVSSQALQNFAVQPEYQNPLSHVNLLLLSLYFPMQWYLWLLI